MKGKEFVVDIDMNGIWKIKYFSKKYRDMKILVEKKEIWKK